MEKNNKFKILFITEKWCDGNSELGLSNNFHNLLGSLRCSGLDVKFSAIHYDEFFKKHRHHVDKALKVIYDKVKPDLIITSFLGLSWMNPTKRIFETLKDNKATLCFMWPDTGYDWAIDKINELGDLADLHVSWGQDHRHHNFPEKHLWLWAPQDETIYYNDEGKTIPCSFVGSLNGYGDRSSYLNYALKNHANLVVLGGQREGRLTSDQYAQYIRDSQIGINFPESPSGIDQCKGRVIEIISCGSMLLERKNNATRKILVPGEDYIEFDSPQDLKEKISFYEQNPKEREQIAANGYKKYCDHFSASKFWTQVLRRCGHEL